jgi:hypothetical protein
VTANAGSGGATFATDDDGTAHHPYVKLEYGADNTQTKVSTTNPLPVQLRSSAGTEVTTGGGVEAAALRVTIASDSTGVLSIDDNGSTVSIDDGAGSLTIDNAALSVTGGGVEASALRVTLASDSTGVLSVDDNGSTLSIDDGGGTITVDGTVAVSGTVTVGSHAVTNAGTFAVQVDGSALTALQLLDDTIFTDDAAFTPGTSKVSVIGAQADESSTDSVDEGDAGALRMTLDRKLHVTAELETNSMRTSGTAATPKFAIIDAATSGDNTIVAAVNPKKIRVLSLFLVASAAVTARFESGAGGTALTGQMQLAANGGFVLPFNPLGWFETASNTLLNLELSGAISVDGGLNYVEVP